MTGRPTRTGALPPNVNPSYRALMDTTPPDDQYVTENVTSNYSGETWRVVRNTNADDGDLTDEEADAMVQAAMERAERAVERMDD